MGDGAVQRRRDQVGVRRPVAIDDQGVFSAAREQRDGEYGHGKTGQRPEISRQGHSDLSEEMVTPAGFSQGTWGSGDPQKLSIQSRGCQLVLWAERKKGRRRTRRPCLATT